MTSDQRITEAARLLGIGIPKSEWISSAWQERITTVILELAKRASARESDGR